MPAINWRGITVLMGLAIVGKSLSHDIWIESDNSLVMLGQSTELSLMLGNHGNQHRDFRLASKVPSQSKSLIILGPSGEKSDLTEKLFDNGLDSKEGFWSAMFQPQKEGAYLAYSLFDQVMTYGPVRDIKCAKVFFNVVRNLDRPKGRNAGFQRSVGGQLELVPISNPFTEFEVGNQVSVCLYLNGKPQPNTDVSFLSKGYLPVGAFDPSSQAKTDSKGIAKFVLKRPGKLLISANVHDGSQSGIGYTSVHYSATLFARVRCK